MNHCVHHGSGPQNHFNPLIGIVLAFGIINSPQLVFANESTANQSSASQTLPETSTKDPFQDLAFIVPLESLPVLKSFSSTRPGVIAEKEAVLILVKTVPRKAKSRILYGGKLLGEPSVRLPLKWPLNVVIRADGYMPLHTRIEPDETRTAITYRLSPSW